MTQLDLTPPADAPLPYSLTPYSMEDTDDSLCVRDAKRGGTLILLTQEDGDEEVARYLVACANAAPGLVAECERLRSALADSVDLAAEGISYTEPYFRTKWKMVERLAAISAVAAVTLETP